MKKDAETKRIYFDSSNRAEQEKYMNALLATGDYIYVDAHRERDERHHDVFHCWWELRHVGGRQLKRAMAGRVRHPESLDKSKPRHANGEAEQETSNGCCCELHQTSAGILDSLPAPAPLIERAEKRAFFGPHAYNNPDNTSHRVWERQCKACRNSCKQHYVPRGCFKCFAFKAK